jgi:hypothetical protein
MRKFVLLISAALFFVALVSSVSAISIVPARTNVEFVPGKTIQLSFGVGAFGSGMGYEVQFDGEYTENAKIIREDVASMVVEFTMPENPNPGLHELKVGIIQAPKEGFGEGAVAAKAAVFSQVRFFVPYPARYAVISIDSADVSLGEMAYFTVYLQNYGKETLENIKGNVSIINPDNESISTVSLSERSNLYSLQTTELFGQWNTENQSAGIYSIFANVDYDDLEATADGILRVGTSTVMINSIRAVGNVRSGVVKINVDISSLWNEPLANVYAKGQITKNSTTLANMKSASLDLNPWGSGTLVLYWDVLGLDVGVYDIKVDLFYGNKTKTATTQIYLMEEETVEKKAEVNTMLYGSILLLVLAVVFFAIVILKLRHHRED